MVFLCIFDIITFVKKQIAVTVVEAKLKK